MEEKANLKKPVLTIFLLAIGLLIYYLTLYKKQKQSSEVCVKNGTGLVMNKEEALRIALQSDCLKEGNLLSDEYMCNKYTGTWWFKLDVFNKRSGCSPACVVDIDKKIAEINWRCAGLETK